MPIKFSIVNPSLGFFEHTASLSFKSGLVSAGRKKGRDVNMYKNKTWV